MSSSNGDPSRKLSWYRSMLAKFKNENRAKDDERRKQQRVTGQERRRQERENQIYGG